MCWFSAQSLAYPYFFKPIFQSNTSSAQSLAYPYFFKPSFRSNTCFIVSHSLIIISSSQSFNQTHASLSFIESAPPYYSAPEAPRWTQSRSWRARVSEIRATISLRSKTDSVTTKTLFRGFLCCRGTHLCKNWVPIVRSRYTHADWHYGIISNMRAWVIASTYQRVSILGSWHSFAIFWFSP